MLCHGELPVVIQREPSEIGKDTWRWKTQLQILKYCEWSSLRCLTMACPQTVGLCRVPTSCGPLNLGLPASQTVRNTFIFFTKNVLKKTLMHAGSCQFNLKSSELKTCLSCFKTQRKWLRENRQERARQMIGDPKDMSRIPGVGKNYPSQHL